MRLKGLLLGFGCVALAYGQAYAADPVISTMVPAPSAGIVIAQAEKGAPQTPQTPVRPAPETPRPMDQLTQAPNNSFAESTPGGTEAAGSFSPQMLGDSLSYVVANTNFSSPGQARVVRSLAGSGFKIADNESPLPTDRAYINTDFYTDILPSLRKTSTSLRLTREVFGYEKTFLDGNASVEVRLPFFQFHSPDGTSTSDFGDITLVGKYAFVNQHSCDSDLVLTAGAAITLPTGPNDALSAKVSINPTIFQPYVGYLVGGERAYAHGFSSFAIPFSSSVPTVWFNDLGLGYYAYKGDGCLKAFVPTLEGHLTTGLGQRGSQGAPIGVLDTLVVTAGVHMVFANHATLTLGYEFPVTGPLPFGSEYVAQFNYHF